MDKYKKELIDLANKGYDTKEMSDYLKNKYNEKFTSKKIANYLSMKNVSFKIRRIEPKKYRDKENGEELPRWIVRNLETYGNCYVGLTKNEKIVDSYIKQLSKIGIKVKKTITNENGIIIEVI